MSSQIEQDAQFVGREVSVRPQKPDGLTVNCTVRDVRRSYNHLELLVEPKDGEGRTWIRRWAEFDEGGE